MPPCPDSERETAVRALRDVSAAELVARRAELQAAAKSAGLTLDDIERILNARSELPRPLLPEERTALSAILEYADFQGRAALVAQAVTARVDGYCGCGCATVSLQVDRSTPAAAHASSPIPNQADVTDDYGDPIGGIIIFLEDGYLASLEIYSFEEPISPIPPLERLRLHR